MPRSGQFLPISAVIPIALFALGACSAPAESASTAMDNRPSSVSAGITASATASPVDSASDPARPVPTDVVTAVRSFVIAYAQHHARDGKDTSYAQAGARASKLATGEMVEILAQQRSGQEGPWAALRAEQATQTVKIESVVTPDGAPAADASSALVRVGYTLTTTPKSGPARSSSEHIALRLDHTPDGWRVGALPWA